MMACYFVPLVCVLPFYHYIAAVPYPAIWLVMAFCGLVVFLIGFTLNFHLERWKDKRIGNILHLLAQTKETTVLVA